MTTPTRISLAQQIEAVRFAGSRARALAAGTTIRSLRGPSVETYDMQRLLAAAQTLEWLARHEAEIRAFVAARKESAS